MTADEAAVRIGRLEKCYNESRDEAAVRNALQDFFCACFSDNIKSGIPAPALLRAYALLRRIENGREAVPTQSVCCELRESIEALVFCADVLSRGTGRRFSLLSNADRALIKISPRDLAFSLMSVLANAVSYSQADEITVTLTVNDTFASVTVESSGSFPAESFQRALTGNGSLGRLSRVLSACGGTFMSCSADGKVLLALKIPLCREAPCVGVTLSAEELLYDRLSAAYIAFCGH